MDLNFFCGIECHLQFNDKVLEWLGSVKLYFVMVIVPESKPCSELPFINTKGLF